MATNYNGMPSDVQNIIKKKKAAVPVPVSNSTTLNTPQAVQDAIVADAKQIPQIGTAASMYSPAPSSYPLATPVAVQDQMIAAANAPIASSTSLNTPIAVQNQMASAANPTLADIANANVNQTTQSYKDAEAKFNADKAGSNGLTPSGSTPTAAGMGMPTDVQNTIQANGVTAAANEAAKIAQDASITKGAITALGVAKNAEAAKGATSSTGNGTSPNAGSGISGSSSASVSGTGSSIVTPTLPGAQPIGIGTTAGQEQTPVKEQNVYFDDLINTKFDYNPATDMGYMQAAAQAENAIIQSIIGRGGLYSSVAQSAVAVKLADLSIEYEKMAYDKYVDERDYKMTLATFEQDRIDTAWEHNFKIDQFNADQEQKKFENQLSLAEFQFAQEKEAFSQKMTLAAAARASASAYASKQSAAAAKTLATKQSALQGQFLENKLAMDKLTEMKTRWAQAGEASAEVADFFSAYGVQDGDSISGYEDIIYKMENNLVDKAYTISNWATEMQEGAMAQEYLSSYVQPAQVTTDSTVSSSSNLANFINSATSSSTTKADYAAAIKDVTATTRYYVDGTPQGGSGYYQSYMTPDEITAYTEELQKYKDAADS